MNNEFDNLMYNELITINLYNGSHLYNKLMITNPHNGSHLYNELMITNPHNGSHNESQPLLFPVLFGPIFKTMVTKTNFQHVST